MVFHRLKFSYPFYAKLCLFICSLSTHVMFTTIVSKRNCSKTSGLLEVAFTSCDVRYMARISGVLNGYFLFERDSVAD